MLNNNVDVSGMPEQVANQYFIVGVGNNNVFDVNTNSFMFHELSKTLGMYHVVNGISSGNIIDIGNKKVVFLTTPSTYGSSTNDVKTINSDLNTGEYLVIRANTGPVKFIAMDAVNETQGRNIFLPEGPSLTIQNGHTATFIKIQDIFQLISVL